MSWRVLEFQRPRATSEEMVAWLGHLLATQGVRVSLAKEAVWGGIELTVELAGRRTLLGVGEVQGRPGTYRAFTRPPSLLDQLLGRSRVRLRREVLDRLHRSLMNDSEARNVRWVEL